MKPYQKRRHAERGVTLIEALIAMAVMAFGMLALVGVQSTLRVNADLARQRVEATKLAEAEVEALRSFITVGSGAAGVAEYDNIGSKAPTVLNLPESNTSYTMSVDVVNEDLRRVIKVTVAWKDRYDTDRSVVVRDILTRASPALPGLLSSVRKLTTVGLNRNRHPTIPARAGDQIGGNESVFKPQETGTIAWVFDNTTGVITRVCVVASTTDSGTLAQSDLSSCENTNAQLLAGFVRFNLRGVTKNLGTISAYKPVPTDTNAWVVDHASSRIVRSCVVPGSMTTADLTLADVALGCPTVNSSVDQPIATFDPTDSASYVLSALDSELALWPAMNLSISLALDSTGHAKAPVCLSNAPQTSIAASLQSVVEYFCIVYPNASQSWFGRSTIAPQAFNESGSAPSWAIGSGTGSFKVCRYTTAGTDFTSNEDHPAYYSKWDPSCGPSPAAACRPVKGNLINQNFLVIDGSKTCPTDTAVNAAAGDLVNSNTLQHQP